MSDLFKTSFAGWLRAEPVGESNLYKTTFAEHHLGNIWIRSLHGGVTGSMIEISAEAETRRAVDPGTGLTIVSSSIDYLRISKDADLYARATIQRLSRRLSIVDVVCWQDREDVPIARGIVSLKIST